MLSLKICYLLYYIIQYTLYIVQPVKEKLKKPTNKDEGPRIITVDVAMINKLHKSKLSIIFEFFGK